MPNYLGECCAVCQTVWVSAVMCANCLGECRAVCQSVWDEAFDVSSPGTRLDGCGVCGVPERAYGIKFCHAALCCALVAVGSGCKE